MYAYFPVECLWFFLRTKNDDLHIKLWKATTLTELTICAWVDRNMSDFWSPCFALINGVSPSSLKRSKEKTNSTDLAVWEDFDAAVVY